ncbi:IclR family transcriptional regulator [Agrobacterium sp. AGB01]|uniref:IclR family transcriptional regulator n=1 Tax=Agrobacterium sp. AGB01 TaxID=2769302 RepID=UPI0017867CF4|nr:IclR family transcriptional regulator [Agrobacterium sp. AGB01]MBD9388493.1 IclR family transcriptional regulator [Agrobacterium sp. AGB01]
MEKTSIDRAFEILDLLDDESPTVSPDEISIKLDLTRSTTYRYLRVLCNAGLLVQLSRGSYSLGPRIVELERKIQISDPMTAVANAIMPGYARQVPNSVLILCGLWGDRVLCLRQENSAANGIAPVPLMRARGLPFSLFKGAASLAILANLPSARIKSLFLKSGTEIAQASLGDNWNDFRRRLQGIKKAGHCITVGTFETGLAAIAAPIFNDEGAVIGSLTRILNRSHAESDEDLAKQVREAAASFSRELQVGMAAHAPVTQQEHRRDAELLGSLIEHV